ncbi:Rrf2 family transcriptional regulator [Vagococcus fluvialis]|uniref:Transcriptional regulator n=1 Tax=Vagococcus fluvialis TaxID=2738 RepID=A0A369B2Z8_9ENTE|nr:Rrf2 family transcriptional regulator [Vagococcus fluvialis]MBO0478932.1 Rrf2 family transcriptional regulator [Vagococcus fluvialis]MBO0484006.1 Rrf2 family transcriptional regulator [Vagococcus fluvialis]MBO0486087.1 Rrf2 family transcriptional regulator [Vagococcus fluvialis]MCM2137626.1 Rrf2 family transcriptional regulator [Vagococcus fluvialis]MDT2746303.1 Rrf2 family transcriptional regulator [Vagococcus fluvialis]
MSTKLSVAVHILSLLDIEADNHLTSTQIAGSVNTNPVVIRRIMGQLKKANLIESYVGKKSNKLSKLPSEITLLDVYLAVHEDELPFGIHQNTEINCVVGSQIQDVLETTYQKIQSEMMDSLKKVTLADITFNMTK